MIDLFQNLMTIFIAFASSIWIITFFIDIVTLRRL